MSTTTVTSDREILDALGSDFDGGFTLMVRTLQPGIYSGARRLTRHHQDAEEITQDTFVRAYSALEGYDDSRLASLRLRPWLWTIALNLCRTRARKKTPIPTGMVEDPFEEPPTEVMDDAAWNAALDRLTEPQRTAVVLRHVLDLPISEIAEITGRPEGTVKADISRGLERLRTTMNHEERP
ncbi:MAG: RNA polymerase sigma factor [Acidimicrobiia bacterium]